MALFADSGPNDMDSAKAFMQVLKTLEGIAFNTKPTMRIWLKASQNKDLHDLRGSTCNA
jgi:hypothetical protein